MLRLPRLRSNFPIITPEGKPDKAFQQWWQSVVEALEAQEAVQDQILADLQQQVNDIAAVQAAAAAADAAAMTAQAAAAAAQAQATAATTAATTASTAAATANTAALAAQAEVDAAELILTDHEARLLAGGL